MYGTAIVVGGAVALWVGLSPFFLLLLLVCPLMMFMMMRGGMHGGMGSGSGGTQDTHRVEPPREATGDLDADRDHDRH